MPTLGHTASPRALCSQFARGSLLSQQLTLTGGIYMAATLLDLAALTRHARSHFVQVLLNSGAHVAAALQALHKQYITHCQRRHCYAAPALSTLCRCLPWQLRRIRRLNVGVTAIRNQMWPHKLDRLCVLKHDRVLLTVLSGSCDKEEWPRLHLQFSEM